jgi:hypothetical protein
LSRAPAALAALVVAPALLAPTLGCGAPAAEANVLVELYGFEDTGMAFEPTALLTVLDAQGRAARVDVDTFDGFARVQTPLELPCPGGFCDTLLRLSPGDYAFELLVVASDRCGARAPIQRLDAPLQSFLPNMTDSVVFDTVSYAYDDDDDGIENALELSVCGRFDVADSDRAPEVCRELSGVDDDGDPLVHACCANDAPELAGHMTRFDGSDAHLLADGSSVAVAPFHLDATEVSWGAFSRCVAAGACLFDAPGHAVRQRLLDPELDLRWPVTGLSPDEAEAYCAWLGKELPTDAQWDFAAAWRGDGARARFPWDDASLGSTIDDTGAPLDDHDLPARADIDCQPDAAGTAANHRAPGRACPRGPMPVGSYGSSHARRGVGVPLADLAGNAWEWTRDGADAVLRGGGWDSIPELLENDLRLVADDAADVDRLKGVAGFRCARALASGEVAADVDDALRPVAEPACGAD